MAPRTPLLDPAGYFARRDSFSLARAAGLVALYWLAVAVFVTAAMELLLANVVNPPPELRAAFDRVLPEVVFALVFAVLVAWLAITVGLYVLARLVGGDGTFASTLATAAWGMAPEFVAMPVKFVPLYLAIDGARLSAESPRILSEQTQALFGSAEGPLGVALALLTTAWSAYVWTHGLARGHDVDLGTAAVPAGVVAFVGLLLDVL